MAKFEHGGLVPRVRLINRPLDGTHPRHAGENFEKERRIELFESVAAQIERESSESTRQMAKKIKRKKMTDVSRDKGCRADAIAAAEALMETLSTL